MKPYMTQLTVRSPLSALVSAGHDSRPQSSTSMQPLRPAGQQRPTSQRNAQEPRWRGDLALAQAHALGWRCRARMIRDTTLGERPVL